MECVGPKRHSVIVVVVVVVFLVCCTCVWCLFLWHGILAKAATLTMTPAKQQTAKETTTTMSGDKFVALRGRTPKQQ